MVMTACMAMDSNEELSAKTTKSRASSLTNSLPTVPDGN